ncbi:MAG: helix-turn-helix transcriptional regulator [Bacteroides sp.]
MKKNIVLGFVKIFLVFVIAGNIITSAAKGENLRARADSLIALLPSLDPPQRLRALTNICDYAYILRDSLFEQLWLQELMFYATKMGDFNTGGFAAISLLDSYYNYEMFEQLEAHYPEIQAYQFHHKNLEYYFAGWSLHISYLIVHERIAEALEELNLMYQRAFETNHIYGKGIAMCQLGSLNYEALGDPKEALNYYRAGLKLLSQMDFVSGTELTAYYDFSKLLLNTENYNELRSYTSLWRKRIKVLAPYLNDMRTPDSTTEYLTYYYATMTNLEAKTNHQQAATSYFNELKRNLQASDETVAAAFYETFETYYSSSQLWDSALYYNRKRLTTIQNKYYDINTLEALKRRAQLLLQTQEYLTASYYFQQYIATHDSLIHTKNIHQIEKINDKLNLAGLNNSLRRLKYIAIVFLLLTLLFLGIIVAIIVHQTQIRRKNKMLCILLQHHLLEQTMENSELVERFTICKRNTQTHLREDDFASYQRLFFDLDTLMNELQLFRNPQLTQQELIERLHTTPHILKNAIRICAGGATLKEYINTLRLDFATQLLINETVLTIKEIEVLAGFDSSYTFTKLFTKKMGLSPSDYRTRAQHLKEIAS